MVTTAFAPAGANLSVMSKGWQSYLPVLTGQTDNPVLTATTQKGNFFISGNQCAFDFTIVTTTITKTTTADTVFVSLPVAAATNTGMVQSFTARFENATAVANALRGEIASGASVATLRNYVLATSSAAMTWAATDPGIGVLTNTITMMGQGVYQCAVS